ncbi:MAG TPA: hypothetical protein VKZ87_12540 [Ferrovibrio sp.]|jgi:hypothetical protein|uniref:hypothetical protein n=1 Tax=Ferrovibrio sp. TaxID=1917215 RepID=UPI002B4AD831|nr:hypothetical protein [Ferrovibrio sp.]HLT78207.1 hypothetical protein [Ferrovibrio sp.]
MRYSLPVLAAAMAVSFAAAVEAQTVALASNPAPTQDLSAMKADANRVVSNLRSAMPLGYLCFRGEDGVRRTVTAAFDDLVKADQEAARKANRPYTLSYDRKQAEALVTDAMVAHCVASYVGTGSASYPSF